MRFVKTTKLTEDEAEELASNVIKHGSIIITNHAKYESMPKRGYDNPDVYHILDKGKVVKIEPGINNTWKYSFRGNDLDGDEGTIVATFVSSDKGVVITVF